MKKVSGVVFVAAAKVAGAGVLAWALSGCAAQQSFSDAQVALRAGDGAVALAKLEEAARLEPNNLEYRKAVVVQRERLTTATRREAEALMDAGEFEAAKTVIDRYEGSQAKEAMGGALTALREAFDSKRAAWKRLEAAEALAAAGKLGEALAHARQVAAEGALPRRAPSVVRRLVRLQSEQSARDAGQSRLRAEYRRPVTTSFTEASVKQVLDSLKAASGLNYVFDKDVQPTGRVTLSVERKPLEDVIAVVLASNQLAMRVLDEDTVLVYPATQQKATEYRELAVRVFTVSNGDANKVAALVRQLTKAKDVQVDERLGMIIVRDAPEVIRVAEKVIAAADLVEPEVMLELEVIEVNKSRLVEAGIQWPTGISASVTGAGGKTGVLSIDELRNPAKSLFSMTLGDPLISAKLKSTVGAATLLANPRIRVRNKTTAKVLIGDKVPVVTVSQNSLGGSSESVSYLDVGLKLDIKPTISADDDVTMDLNLEVSNIVETVVRTSGTQTYRIGTRNTTTSLRVGDGETSVLGGLIRNEERRSNAGLPYVNEAPVVGKLFGQGADADQQTEIVLMVTPRVIRPVEMPQGGTQEYAAGTESSVGARNITITTGQVNQGREHQQQPSQATWQQLPTPAKQAVQAPDAQRVPPAADEPIQTKRPPSPYERLGAGGSR